MKKILLGTSALAVAALTAGAASADAPTVAFDGKVSYALVGYGGENEAQAGTGWDVKADNYKSELHWTATGAADNGLEYTGRVDWRYLTATLDEAWINLGGSWGSVTLGMEDGVEANVPDANSIAGGSWGNDGNYKFYAASSALTSVTAAGHDGDANKIAYYSPDFGGFGVSASISPSSGTRTSTAQPVDGTYQNTAEILASYGGDFGGVGVNLGAAYVMADATNEDSIEDARSWHIGGTVSVADFSFGAGYVDNGDSGTAVGSNGDAGYTYNVGVAYGGIENIYLSAVYTAGESDVDGNNVDATGEGWSASADYTVADGLTTFVEYIHNEYEDGTGTTAGNSESDIFLLGTTVAF